MTSEQRHEARYQRRRAKREAKAAQVEARSFEEVMSFGNLAEAGRMACNGSRWKSSTIRFEANLLGESARILEELEKGVRSFRGFRSFRVTEHGKTRNIDALQIRERAAQKCLCRHLLIPALSRSFISTNSASLPGKGMTYALEKLKAQLRAHYRKHGTAGGILQFDFKNYFGSLPHDGIKSMLRKHIRDDRLYELACSYVDDFTKRKYPGETEDGRPAGVGLGSEISQIIALAYASPIDHYVTDQCGISGYGRYMDDGYVICDSIDRLKEIRRRIFEMAEAMGLRIHPSKCTITPLAHHAFQFLKFRFSLTDTGRAVMKLSRRSVRAVRRKMLVFRSWLDAGRIDAEAVFQAYQSWRAHARRADSYQTLHRMDVWFVGMFAEELAVRRLRFPCTVRGHFDAASGWHYAADDGRKENHAG